MLFEITTDSSANLPGFFLNNTKIKTISFPYVIDGEECFCPKSADDFDGDAFFERLRKKSLVTTSLINPEKFTEFFEPVLSEGKDILHISMSSGISGTVQAANIAAEDLKEKYPDRKIIIFDTLAASMGEGLFVFKAVELKQSGKSMDEIHDILLSERNNMCQFFTVGNLMHLKRTGRVSFLNAIIGTALHVKPLLKGDAEGKIVVFEKAIGRKKALLSLAELYRKNQIDSQNKTVAIAHCGCLDEAQQLGKMITEICKPKELIINGYDPSTGSHVGPDTIALFFEGKNTK